jgi:hypothetical protein
MAENETGSEAIEAPRGDEPKVIEVKEPAASAIGVALGVIDPEGNKGGESPDVEFRKVAVGVYSVWQVVSPDRQIRVGSVGRINSGEWQAYSTTGRPSKGSFPTRHEAGEALVNPQRG